MIQDSLLSDFKISNYNSISSGQFFSYYPKYEYLDNLLSVTKQKSINLYVDVKGCAPALYQDWGVHHIIDYSKTSRHISLHPFCGILSFIAFHKLYAAKRGLDIHFYFFMEQGRSKYHLKIYDKYKSNRDLSNFFGLDLADRDYFLSVLDKNYDLDEYIINRIPNCYFYRLKYCEADFMPWYLMKYIVQDVDQSLNIIYSRDKDMHQCLSFPNTYQYYRAQYADKSCFIHEKNFFEHWFKTKCTIDIPKMAEWFPLFLSMVGDSGDDIPGIKGVGPKTIVKFIDAIYNVYGKDSNKMYEIVMNGKSIINESIQYGKTATLEKLFSNEDILRRNMKLISYRALSEYITEPNDTESIEIRKYIDKISNNDQRLSNASVLWQSMKSKGMDDNIDQETVERCFLNSKNDQ